MMSELIKIEPLNVLALYQDGGIDGVLAQIEQEVLSHVADIATAKGRKNIASLAYKVSQSKVALDELGKQLTEEWKVKAKKVDSERKRMRDRLDALRDKVRQPLTCWEQAEKKRIDGHETAIAEIIRIAAFFHNNWRTCDLSQFASSLTEVTASRDWQEFTDRAERAIAEAKLVITECKANREQHDAEQVELAKLRKANEERLQKERDEQIAREAAERAKRDAEAAAEKQLREVEASAKRAAEAAERQRLALENAKLDAELRAKKAEAEILAERERIRDAEKLKQAEQAKLLADEAHCRACIDAAVMSLVSECHISNSIGHDIVNAVNGGRIEHMRMVFDKKQDGKGFDATTNWI